MIKQQIEYYRKRVNALKDDVAHINHKMTFAVGDEMVKLKTIKQHLVDEQMNYLGKLEELGA